MRVHSPSPFSGFFRIGAKGGGGQPATFG